MSDIFSAAEEAPGIATPPNVSFADLVGEGKKFADAEALAKAKAEADFFINKLKEENKALREAVTKEINAADNLTALQKEMAELREKLNKKSVEPSQPTAGDLTAGQNLEELVSRVITKNEQARTANQNLSAVNDVLVRQHGSLEKAQEFFNAKAAELNLSAGELKALAAKSPTAFYQVIGVKPDARPEPGLPVQKVNPAAMPSNPGSPKKGTAAYYSNLRKEMGTAKFFADVALQQEIIKAAKQPGFYDKP